MLRGLTNICGIGGIFFCCLTLFVSIATHILAFSFRAILRYFASNWILGNGDNWNVCAFVVAFSSMFRPENDSVFPFAARCNAGIELIELS